MSDSTMSEDILPSDDGLRRLLKPWKGARAYEIPIAGKDGQLLGNHGDTIMRAVYRRMLTKFGPKLVEDPIGADVLIVPPNGALLDRFDFPGLLRDRLALLPDVPVVIFPSSSLFVNSDPARMFAGRRSAVTWILREELSYRHLSEKWGKSLERAGVSLELSHDVVTMGGAFVRDVFSEARLPLTAGEPIVAGRLDSEGALGVRDMKWSGSAGRNLVFKAFHRSPLALRRMLRRRTTRDRQIQVNEALVLMLDEPMRSVFMGLRRSARSIDISDPNLVSFTAYMKTIASASSIVTNRLHVALPSAILGKETILVDGGYHKLRGVYERSLTSLNTLHFVSPGEAE